MHFSSYEITAAIIISAGYIAVFSLSKIVHKIKPEFIELSRKTAHFIGGIISSVIMFFITDTRIMAVMCICFFLLLILTKLTKSFKGIHDIERESWGAFLFPVSAFIIFVLSKGNPYLYFISLLVLAVSDAAAALIGSRYGSVKIEVEGNLKSLEGSAAFFLLTFICIETPLLLFMEMDNLHIILISFIAAIVVTGFELISLHGTDNLFIPLGTFYIINRISGYPLDIAYATIIQLLISVVLISLIFFKLKYFKLTSRITVMLYLFAAFALCGHWWPAPTFYFIVIIMITLRLYVNITQDKSMQVRFILRQVFIPVIILFLSAGLDNLYILFPSYLSVLLITCTVIAYELLIEKKINHRLAAGILFLIMPSGLILLTGILYNNIFRILPLSIVIITGSITGVLYYLAAINIGERIGRISSAGKLKNILQISAAALGGMFSFVFPFLVNVEIFY